MVVVVGGGVVVVFWIEGCVGLDLVVVVFVWGFVCDCLCLGFCFVVVGGVLCEWMIDCDDGCFWW